MRTALKAAAVIAAAASAITLAGCGGGTGDAAACKAAMSRDYATALEHPGASPAAQPFACKGLSDATLKRLAAEVMAGASAVPSTPAASAPSARAIAEQIGATDVQPSDPTLYASEEVTAVWHGRDVSIATFASTRLKENWVKIAEQFTPIMTVGPQFAIADLGPAGGTP
jgi:hypothetical protein